MGDSFGSCLGYVAVGMVTKFLLSLDDLVWLGFFFANATKNKGTVAVLYIAGVSAMQFAGAALGYCAHTFLEGNEDTVEFWIQIVAGFILALYAIKVWTDDEWDCMPRWKHNVGLLCNYCGYKYDQEIEHEILEEKLSDVERTPKTMSGQKYSANVIEVSPSRTHTKSNVNEPADLGGAAQDLQSGKNGVQSNRSKDLSHVSAYGSVLSHSKTKSKSKSDLSQMLEDLESKKKHEIFIVAVLASIDESVAFIIVAFSMGHFIWVFIGGVCAAFCIMTLTYFMTMNEKYTDILQGFPDWIIFATLALYMWVDGFISYFD